MVKIFSAATMLELEKKLNDWLAAEIVIVKSISYAIGSFEYSALVFYAE